MIEMFYFVPLFVGIIVFTAGTLISWVIRRQKGDRQASLLIAITSVVMGTWLIGIFVASPSLSSRRIVFNGALHSPVDDIDEVDIKPCPKPNHISLVATPIVIRDRAVLTQIADTLDHATSFLPNHPQERWSAWITVKTKKGEYGFVAVQTTDATNGTMIDLQSDLTEDWTIGKFRSDQFGGIIELIAQRHMSERR